ncbi:interleukin-31 receptor subunit alpha-like [Notolabrus celidotus]|uniref:interleukin-31 receptor subunit alpha-like n=1 Tax=Notolabrus celidotus TaxID=1203425 RepID=UPI00148FD69F|nr:interleukin-31 receptor subunit alpha-like [Notolabrus celidotus]
MNLHLVQFILIVIASVCKGQHENNCNVVPKDHYIEVGSDTKIVCQTPCVHGKVFWTLNSTEIDESQSSAINSSHTVLSLRNFTERSATLLCHSAATRDVLGGTTVRTFSKPSKISCILDYETQGIIGVPELLTCNWEHLINPSKYTNYTVLSSSWSHESQSEICSSNVTTCTAKYSKILDKIPLLGTFSITVRANSTAFDTYSETQEFTPSHIWKIVRPKLDVSTHPDRLVVKWTQMGSSMVGNCTCQVKYSKANIERSPERVIDETLQCEERGSITIAHVESCNTYKFAVRCALDEAPWSDWSLEKRVLTRLNMTNVKLQLWRIIAKPLKEGSRKVHVMWTGIPSTCQDTLTYTIKLIPLKKHMTGANYTETIMCGNATCDVDVDQDAHRILLTMLRNDALSVQDSVYVPAVGESLPQVTDIQTSTLEGVILVSWKAPVQPVSGYMIDYTHDGNQYSWKESEYTNITLNDLRDKKPYNITVTPLFNGKTGHSTQALQICSSVGDPANVTIINVQAYDKSAIVSWDVKSQVECRGVVVRYTVFFSTQKRPQLNVTLDSTRRNISLKNLTPNTHYHVYVKATALTGTTQSSEWLFITKRFDPRLFTALLICGGFTMVLLLILGVCCAVQWKKFKEKPVPNPGLSSVALWSSASCQEGTILPLPFSNPRESWCDRVYPEEIEGSQTSIEPTDCKDKPAMVYLTSQTVEYTVPDVVPAADTQNEGPGEAVETMYPSTSGESTALLLSESNQSSPYRSQSSVQALAQRTSKQGKHVAVTQQEKTETPTVYVTLDMFAKGKGQLKEIETKPQDTKRQDQPISSE